MAEMSKAAAHPPAKHGAVRRLVYIATVGAASFAGALDHGVVELRYTVLSPESTAPAK